MLAQNLTKIYPIFPPTELAQFSEQFQVLNTSIFELSSSNPTIKEEFCGMGHQMFPMKNLSPTHDLKSENENISYKVALFQKSLFVHFGKRGILVIQMFC